MARWVRKRRRYILLGTVVGAVVSGVLVLNGLGWWAAFMIGVLSMQTTVSNAELNDLLEKHEKEAGDG